MPRLMSVAHTIDAVVARRKTETRRLGWRKLPVGAELDLCEKVMGRRKGDPLVRLARVHVTEVHLEPLRAVTDEQVYAEGFTEVDLMFWPGPHRPPLDWTPRQWFVGFYADRFLSLDVGHSHAALCAALDTEVTRICWRYLPDPPEWATP